MLKKLLFTLLFLAFTRECFAEQIQSPAEFLGYKLGARFTPHARLIEYYRYIASASKNVRLLQYGTTNEDRPLLVVFIGSDENINRLEDIRQHNLSLSGQADAHTDIKNAPVIVWLSYNVHGNEPSSSEASMQALFDLVDPANEQSKTWLKNTLVIIDPCLNPDGRERYVNFYRSAVGVVPNPDPAASEHQENWPGGRTNHYYYDLNRDWAWQTQKETRSRIALFNQWQPEVHVDFHEQGYNTPYYFAPAAEPFHRDITGWQKEFQTVIGKNNAKYFDQHGWLYYTKEEYDLLYPSYGDTYPIYNGSIGMTYEQGGIGGGLAIITSNGDTLTLADRIAHHLSNSLSTVEIASNNANRLLDEFRKYFDEGRTNPPGAYKSYVIKNDNNDKIKLLTEVLQRNGIKYGFGVKAKSTGYSYIDQKTTTIDIDEKDLVISANQPKAVLLHVLLEPKTFVADSNTYDITAWSLPYAYGLNAYGLKDGIKPLQPSLPDTPKPVVSGNTPSYAYLCSWKSEYDLKFLAALLKKNIKVRFNENPFEAGGKQFAPGSLIITRAGNSRDDFDRVVQQAAKDADRELTILNSGFVDKGPDLGANSVRPIQKPRILLVSGEGTSSNELGEVWYFFEQEIGYPVTLVPYKELDRLNWSNFDVAILPDGYYEDMPADKLQGWVHNGGKLILMENAITHLVGKNGFTIKNLHDDKNDTSKNNADLIKSYGNRDRDAIRSNVPGAIFKVDMDNTHPLGYGLDKYYFTLKLNDVLYKYMGDDGWNVGTIKKNAYVAGFVGQKAKEKIKDGLLFGVQNWGRGSIVYLADDPLFRSFWENGKLLFGNAVFRVGN